MKIRTLVAGTVGVIWLCIGCQLSWPAAAKEYSPPPAPDIPIEDFVHRIYPRGVPYREASGYATGSDAGQEHVNKLLPLLDEKVEKKEKSYWSNIVATLGMIGHPTVVDPLIKFVGTSYENSYQKSIDWPRVRAKRSALIALGYVINRHMEKDSTTPGKKAANTAVRFLCGRLGQENPCDLSNQSELVTAYKIDRKATDGKSKRKKDAVTPYLQQAAILGLALSGSPEGAEALRNLEEPSIRVAREGSIEKIFGEIREFAPFSFTELLGFLPIFEEVKSTHPIKNQNEQLVQPRVVTPLNEARSAHKAIRQNGKNGLVCYYDPKSCKTEYE